MPRVRAFCRRQLTHAAGYASFTATWHCTKGCDGSISNACIASMLNYASHAWCSALNSASLALLLPVSNVKNTKNIPTLVKPFMIPHKLPLFISSKLILSMAYKTISYPMTSVVRPVFLAVNVFLSCDECRRRMCKPMLTNLRITRELRHKNPVWQLTASINGEIVNLSK